MTRRTNKSNVNRKSITRTAAACAFEAMEARQMMSASLANGTLSINGTAGNDTIFVIRENNNIKVTDNGQVRRFNRDSVQRIKVSLGAGNDNFVFNTLFSGTNADKVTDFVLGEDHITIDLTGFAHPAMGGADLQISTSTYFRYNSATGALMYDEDGFGTGKASVNIAVLGTTTHPATLLDADVTIIA